MTTRPTRTSTPARRRPPGKKKRARKAGPEQKKWYQQIITPSQKIKKRDVIGFTREVTTLLEAGISMVPALNLVADQRAGQPLEKITRQIIDDLNSGLPFAEALAKHPKVFNRFYTATVATADRGAPIVAALRHAAEFLESAESAIAEAKRALIYPAIVTVVGIGITLLLITVALPPMIGLFETLDAGLPMPTRILIATSKFLEVYKLHVGVGFIALMFGLYRYLKTPSGHMKLHRLMLKLPVVAKVVVHSDVARAAGAMAALTEAGLPLPEAMDVATATASNEVIREALIAAKEGLLAGEGLATPLAATGVFPITFVQTLKVAEDTGTLDANLRRMANYYQAEASESVKSVVGLLEPLSTVTIAGLVGFIAMAVIMPMYTILGQLG